MARYVVDRNAANNMVVFRVAAKSVGRRALDECIAIAGQVADTISIKNIFKSNDTTDFLELSDIPFDEYYVNDSDTRAGQTQQEAIDAINEVLSDAVQFQDVVGEYDIYVREGASAAVATGEIAYPYADLQTAIDNAQDNSNIRISGNIEVSAPVVLPTDKSLFFFGAEDSVVKYNAYDNTNTNIIEQLQAGSQKVYKFDNIKFQNAGTYAINIDSAVEVEIVDCEFENNGWNGQGLNTIVSSSVSTLVGFDSPQADITTFNASSNVASVGAAMKLSNITRVELTSNVISKNAGGIHLFDCGVNGVGFIARNQISQNLTSAIAMMASSSNSTTGCENFMVYNNGFYYNACNGITVNGGINNTVALNQINGNWNAGIYLGHVSNCRLRDMDLSDNNRSPYNGRAEDGRARSSIEIAGNTLRTDADFLTEILDTQVYNTGLGASTERTGLYIAAEVSDITNRDHANINIDDVGFKGQDYAIDMACDLDNIKVTIGDCRYIDVAEKNVRTSQGNYYELPFSNHSVGVKYLDASLDESQSTIILKEGVSGNVINNYPVNSIRAVLINNEIQIVLKDSNKIQLDNVLKENVSVNGISTNNTNQATINVLNSLFEMEALGGGGDAQPVPSTDESDAALSSPDNYNDSHVDDSDVNEIVATTSGNNHAGLVTDETINEYPENFKVSLNSEPYIIGLTNNALKGDLFDGTGSKDTGVYFGIEISSVTNAVSSTFIGSSNLTASKIMSDEDFKLHSNIESGNDVDYKVGFDADGYIAVYVYSIIDAEYKVIARTTQLPAADNYSLAVKLLDTGSTAKLPIKHNVNPEGTIALTYYFIESPDGSFHYPLFQTAEEANQYDSLNGGIGSSHTHSYVDETPASNIWYMPDNGSTMNGNAAPINANGVVYNEISTGPDNNYVPAQYSQSLTVDELTSVNFQVAPVGATYTTTLSNLPTGLSQNLTFLQGTAPEVLQDNVANPSDEYQITVTRTNSFGSSVGTLTLTVTNLTLPTTTISGITNEHGSTVDNGDGTTTLSAGAVVSVDDLLNNRSRFIIDELWLEGHVLPYLINQNDEVFIGVSKASPDYTSIDDLDFDAFISFSNTGVSNQHTVELNVQGFTNSNNAALLTTNAVNSLSDAIRSYAIEIYNNNIYLLGDTLANLQNNNSIQDSGSFQLSKHLGSYTGNNPAKIVIAAKNTDITIDLNGLTESAVPLPVTTINVTESGTNLPLFNGSSTMPTLAAGTTYKFLVDDSTIESGDVLSFVLASDGTTAYTTGVTTTGVYGTIEAYVEFAVPSDVPPLKWQWNASQGAVNISGSTYVAPVTGITLEGPSANQTGNNLFDAPVNGSVEWGWLSIDEQLGAGQRLVLNNTFMVDLVDAMPNNSMIAIGLKDANWSNNNRSNSNTTSFEGAARFEIYRYSASDVRFYAYSSAGSIAKFVGTNGTLNNNIELAFDLTSSGNNIRLMIGSSSNSSDDVTSTAYADWNSSYKIQTGNQGFGLTNVDIMFLGDGQTIGNQNQASEL